MKYTKWIVSGTVGALLGFAYWHFVGCRSGSCAITSSPVISSLYGALISTLLVNAVSGGKENKNQEK